MNHPQNLLIIRTDRIGDVVLSLPLAELVKKKYPGCRITFLVREYTSSLVADHPFIDEVLILSERDNKIPIRGNTRIIRQKNFDACIVVYPTFVISLIMFLSGIKTRIGSGYRWYSFLFNKKVFEHRKYAEKHELEYNVNLLKQIGIDEKVDPGNINFHIKVDNEEVNIVKNILSEIGIRNNDKIVVIHPGSGGSSVDLPINKMKELTRSVSEIENVKVIITGNENEIPLSKNFVLNENIINLTGKLNLKQLTALISISDLFISNSTGPLHIAAALGKYVIAFYPKILSCSIERWGPYTTKCTVYTPVIDCTNCNREQCAKLDCMNSIDIGRVFVQTKTVLENF